MSTGANQPKYPYTNAASALRKLLAEIPKRPKPPKLTLDVLKTWAATATNDASPVRVLKDIGMVGSSGEPLQPYVDFMQPPPKGPRALGGLLKTKYSGLFETSHQPQKNQEELKTWFNIHGGGGERTIELQIQTFKALCEYAAFDALDDGGLPSGAPAPGSGGGGTGGGRDGDASPPSVQIALHIHLPENKTARDYEAIIQDIAKYIFGRAETRG